MITGLYIAIFALIQAGMVVWIARTRMKEKVSLGVSDSEILERRTRVYGNFIEIVPMGLILMAVAEVNGAGPLAAHVIGVLLVLSRASHAYGLLVGPGYGLWRMVGMILAMLTFMIGAALCSLLVLF